MPTEEQLLRIRQGVADSEARIKTAEDEIRLAERAGVDVSARKQQLADLKNKVRMIKSAYGV